MDVVFDCGMVVLYIQIRDASQFTELGHVVNATQKQSGRHREVVGPFLSLNSTSPHCGIRLEYRDQSTDSWGIKYRISPPNELTFS